MKSGKSKIKVFDHHAKSFDIKSIFFLFLLLMNKTEGKRMWNFFVFQYLKKFYSNAWLLKTLCGQMIELVRQGDTFCFYRREGKGCFSFGSLYAIYGRERYIEHFYEYILTHEVFSFFLRQRKYCFLLEEEKRKRYIEEKMEHIKFATLSGFRVGIVFAEQNRSLLGHEMAKRLDIDIAVVVIDVDRSVSYRAEKEDVDASVLTISYGVEGHKHACGSHYR